MISSQMMRRGRDMDLFVVVREVTVYLQRHTGRL